MDFRTGEGALLSTWPPWTGTTRWCRCWSLRAPISMSWTRCVECSYSHWRRSRRCWCWWSINDCVNRLILCKNLKKKEWRKHLCQNPAQRIPLIPWSRQSHSFCTINSFLRYYDRHTINMVWNFEQRRAWRWFRRARCICSAPQGLQNNVDNSA